MEDYIISFYEEKEKQNSAIDNPTIKEIFYRWADRRLNLKKISESTYSRYVQDFNRFYGDFGQIHIRELTDDQIQDFLEEQIYIHNLSAKGFSALKLITRGILKFAKRKKYISFPVEETLTDIDASEYSFKLIEKKDCEEVFFDDELEKIILYLMENRDIHNLGILLMFVTGIRVGELVALKYEDFDDPTTFHIRRTETKFRDKDGKWHKDIKEKPKTKAGKRTVVIPNNCEWIYKEIRKINPFSDYLFTNNGTRMSTDAIRKRMYRICDKLDIVKKSPHKCRKTYVSILLDNNIDRNMIIQQVGHTDINCSELYYHKNRKTIDQKKKIISSLPEFSVIKKAT